MTKGEMFAAKVCAGLMKAVESLKVRIARDMMAGVPGFPNLEKQMLATLIGCPWPTFDPRPTKLL